MINIAMSAFISVFRMCVYISVGICLGEALLCQGVYEYIQVY